MSFPAAEADDPGTRPDRSPGVPADSGAGPLSRCGPGGPDGLPGPTAGSLVASLTALGASAAAAQSLERDLLRRWAEPHRRYHDRRHLAEVLDRVTELADHADRPELVRLAAWWHDAVHAGHAGADEEASAALAERQLPATGLSPDDAAEVGRLVRLTTRHDPDPSDADGAVLCDADLAILAAGPTRYAEYLRDVRAEYAQVSEAAFRAGRARVLRRLLDRGRLFRTPTGRTWESAARANVLAELDRLDQADRPD